MVSTLKEEIVVISRRYQGSWWKYDARMEVAQDRIKWRVLLAAVFHLRFFTVTELDNHSTHSHKPEAATTNNSSIPTLPTVCVCRIPRHILTMPEPIHTSVNHIYFIHFSQR